VGHLPYTYDGMGERVAKAGTKLYWKGVGSTALVETNTSDTSPTMYIFFNGARIARIDPGTSTAKYYVTDNVGSTAVETDYLGNQLNASLFFPYGVERIIQQSDTANNYRFTGKERDEETGLDDFGARYYDSSLGRFMTPDWDAKPVTVPYASFGDPQTLNLYSYVENGPLNRVDADGHASAQATPMNNICMSSECLLGMTTAIAPGIADPAAVETGDEARYNSQVQQAFADTANAGAQPAQAQSQQAQQTTTQKVGAFVKQKVAGAQKWAADHPRTMAAAKAGVAAVGTAVAVTAIVATAPVSVPATLAGAAATGLTTAGLAIGASGGAVATVTYSAAAIMGDEKMTTAGDNVNTLTNASGLGTTIMTGGNLKAGGVAADSQDILTGGPEKVIPATVDLLLQHQ